MSPYLSRLLYAEVVVTSTGSVFNWNTYVSTKGNSNEQVFTQQLVMLFEV